MFIAIFPQGKFSLCISQLHKMIGNPNFTAVIAVEREGIHTSQWLLFSILESSPLCYGILTVGTPVVSEKTNQCCSADWRKNCQQANSREADHWINFSRMEMAIDGWKFRWSLLNQPHLNPSMASLKEDSVYCYLSKSLKHPCCMLWFLPWACISCSDVGTTAHSRGSSIQ